MRALRLPAGVLVVATLLLGARPARAEGARSVRFEVRGPAGCADETRLSSEVRARTQRARPAVAGETPDLTLLVRVLPGTPEHLATGELILTDARGLSTHRELAGESCDAVVSGLALVAALAIDPSASTGVLSAVAVAPAPPPPPPPPAPSMPARVVASGASEPSTTLDRDKAPPPPVQRLRWRPRAGVSVGTLGMGNLVATFGAFGDLALESPSLLAPAFRLSVQGSLPTTVNATATNDSATLTWVFARTEACPLRVALSSSVDARPCAFVDGGILDAAGGGPANAQTKLGPWVTAGALARVTWLRELSARWALVLEAQAGLVVPIVRQTFTFVPEITVYQAPAVTGLASIGAGVRFP